MTTTSNPIITGEPSGSTTLGPYASVAALNAAADAIAAASGASAIVVGAGMFDKVGAAWRPRVYPGLDASAIFKPRGSQQQLIPGYATNTAWAKVRAPGKYSAVRVWIMSRGYRPASGYTVALAPTDKSGNASVNDAALPQKSGTVYNAAATTSNPWGWYQATFGSAQGALGYGTPQQMTPRVASPPIYPGAAMRSTWDAMSSDHAISAFVATDFVPMPALVDANGDYYVIVKISKQSGVFGLEEIGGGSFEWTNAQAVADIAANRIVAIPTAKLPAGDFATAPTAVPTGVFSGADTVQTVPFFLEFLMDASGGKTVRSFAFVGESHFEGYLYATNAFANISASAPGVVLNSSNWGMSSNRSSEYYTNFDNYLRAGMRVTDVVIHTLSTNDAANSGSTTWEAGGSRDFALARSFEQIRAKCDEYRSVGLKPWVALMWYGGATGTNASIDAYRARIRSFCAVERINIIDVQSGWNYSDSSWSVDGTHASGPGLTWWDTVLEAAVRADLGV